ncbi:hypothetical protein [Methylobacterium soli]|uniref:Uncharacterized protein n=1 Tax=Methylobacterium soli TaxID=553447 RepID=A0A6L3SZ63_9HYPH|nr:hypothetical protein [Methylobacterium soli]KAB1079344.1 hypothetical protein F6X53_11080 [Methylobacterium soli]GJE41285.1 hypothetical protein AEGHOMDF_0447 [Methylobacterium soli]
MSARRHLDPETAFWRGRPLRDGDFDWLRRQGVPGPVVNWSRGNFEPLLRAAVVFRRGRRFDFARDLRGDEIEPVAAYTLLARDLDGTPLDVVAWHPRSERVAVWSGQTGLLGLDHPTAATADDPLVVFPDLPAWLAGERRGVVVIDERLARPVLLDAGTVQAAGIEHGEALEAMLREVRLPRIVVPAFESERAAA